MSINWEPLYQKYKGKWVALDQDEITVIASGNTLQDAYDQAVWKGCKKPVMTKMPKQLVTFIGGYGFRL